ncbi:butyrophilin subfamily 3 member A2-like [Scomber japonicus]|uniref:butyrophilin subfamily 3 member A2-like n=1 Tax=Scomber japonicus TaxID=13676 RepID=UPI0023058B43|nr:butyrophilin subfamily 3 member A2-like [Scomber japonicus]
MMLCKTDRLMFKCHLKALSVLVFHLLLLHFGRGVARLTGPSQPVIATLGDDIILPCHLDPAVDASGFTLEWTRPDLNPRFVHVWRDGVELVGKKHKYFEGRTSLFIDELKNGNISLKLSKVKVSDKGRYRCFIPGAETQSFAELVVGSVSSPVIKLAGVDRDRGGVILRCESKGWCPEPEVFWLNGEGNLLSAGPTETVRGPEGLYTVSSRVTVEKRHNNNFTCRVQQKNINQTRETHIIVSDDFFMFPFCNSAVPIITGLAVILAGIVLILTIVLFVWRKNRTNKMRNYTVKSERGQNGNDTELQALSTEQKEGEEPLTTPTVLEKNKGGEKKTENTLNQQLQEEQQQSEEDENRLKTMEQELENMNKVENKHTELQELHEVHQKKQEDLQELKEKIETTNKELLRIRNSQSFFQLVSDHGMQVQ